MVNQIVIVTSEKIFSVRNFRILVLLITMFMMVPYFHFYYGSYVKYVLAFGVITILFQLLSGKIKGLLRENTNIILMLFSFSYLITIFINSDIQFIANIKAWLYMVVFFVLLYMQNNLDAQQMDFEIKLISCLVIGVTFLFSLTSLFTYLIGLENAYMLGDPQFVYRLGIYDGRLWGLYNPNVGSMLSVISIFLSGFLAKKTFENKKKNSIYCVAEICFLIINLIVQYICLVLTSSRTSFYAFVIVLFGVTFCFVVHKRSKISLGVICKSFVVSVAVVAVIFFCNKATHSIMPIFSAAFSEKYDCVYLQQVFLEIMPKNPWAEDAEQDITTSFLVANDKENIVKVISLTKETVTVKPTVYARDDIEHAGSLSGRDLLWKAGFSAFTDDWLFGTSREGLYERVRHILVAMPGGYSLETDLRIGGLHNMYLTVLVSSGVVGFILLLLFALINIKDIALCICRQRTVTSLLFCPLIMVILFLICEMTEARILFQVNTFNVMFWLFLGYIRTYINQSGKV